MKITAATKTAISKAMAAKGWRNPDLGNAIGRSRSWVSKVLAEQNEITELSDDMIDLINDALDIVLNPVSVDGGRVSPVAVRLSELAESDSQVAVLLETLMDLAEPELAYIPTVHQKELIKVGAELTRIVHKWEEANDPHYAKIGAESLTYLRKFLSKRKSRKGTKKVKK